MGRLRKLDISMCEKCVYSTQMSLAMNGTSRVACQYILDTKKCRNRNEYGGILYDGHKYCNKYKELERGRRRKSKWGEINID